MNAQPVSNLYGLKKTRRRGKVTMNGLGDETIDSVSATFDAPIVSQGIDTSTPIVSQGIMGPSFSGGVAPVAGVPATGGYASVAVDIAKIIGNVAVAKAGALPTYSPGYIPPGMDQATWNNLNTVQRSAYLQAQASQTSSMTPILILGGIALVGFLLMRGRR